MPYILLLLSFWKEEEGCSGGCGKDILYWVAVKVPQIIADELAPPELAPPEPAQDELTQEELEQEEQARLDQLVQARLTRVKELWSDILSDMQLDAKTRGIVLPEFLSNEVIDFLTDENESHGLEVCVTSNKSYYDSCCNGWSYCKHKDEFISTPNEYDDNQYEMETVYPPAFDFEGDHDIMVVGPDEEEFNFTLEIALCNTGGRQVKHCFLDARGETIKV